MSVDMERSFEWDDTIKKDSEFVLLQPGDYDFEVVEFERARHPGSEKLPPCNKAVVTLHVATEEGNAIIKHNLFLHSKTEGMLCSFFIGIGQRKHGEPLKMDWNKVVGATGRAKIEIRKFEKDDGTVSEFNQVKKFYKPEEKKFEAGKF